MAEELVGRVSHYFSRVQVAVVKLSGEVKLGDVLHFQGHTTDFQQEITSMEIEHARVEQGTPGEEVAIQVNDRVRKGDEVYRVSP